MAAHQIVMTFKPSPVQYPTLSLLSLFFLFCSQKNGFNWRIVSPGLGLTKMMNSYISAAIPTKSSCLVLSFCLSSHNVSESPDTILSLYQSNICLYDHSLAFWISKCPERQQSQSQSLSIIFPFCCMFYLFVTLQFIHPSMIYTFYVSRSQGKLEPTPADFWVEKVGYAQGRCT